MRILSIETSCDETAVAVVEKTEPAIKVLAETVASSLADHITTGGIVPEVAARRQLEFIIPTLITTLKKAGAESSMDAIAVTYGPGLIGSLLVGVETAKTLSYAWNKPLIPVNHLLGHVFSCFLERDNPPEFPALALVVSGNHTDFLLMSSPTKYQLIGQTRDDAVGECLDKCARALGFPYPGGPHIQKLSLQYQRTSKTRLLPRPLYQEATLDTSFSGLKAAFVREVMAQGGTEKLTLSDKQILAFELQQAIVDVLIKKINLASERYKFKSLLFSGGVAANLALRQACQQIAADQSINFFTPEIKYCMDNAAMIGAAALYNNYPINPVELKADPGLQL